jgi:hypothetical protein
VRRRTIIRFFRALFVFTGLDELGNAGLASMVKAILVCLVSTEIQCALFLLTFDAYEDIEHTA